MQFSDPNAGLFGDGSPYGNVGLPYRGQRRRYRGRGCLGCLIPLFVIAVVLALISFAWDLTINWGPTIIKVGAHPTLVIENVNNPHSQIHIHAAGSKGQIVIQPNRPLNLPFGLSESYQISNDQQTVVYDLGIDVSGIFDIAVPAQTNLKVDANNAALLVEGITGRMTLVNNSGSLTVKNCNIVGPSLIQGNSGEIQTLQDHLNGSVIFDNNSAGITFQGALDPLGNYHFTGNGGSITLTLPQNTAANIDASTLNSGSITSNFPGVKAQSSNNGFVLHANIGATPRAQLTLYNNGGSITVNGQGGN